MGLAGRWYCWARRLRLEWSFHPVVAHSTGLVLWVASLATRKVSRDGSFWLLCWSHRELMRGGHRGWVTNRLNQAVERSLRRECAPRGGAERYGRGEPRVPLPERWVRGTGIVLKAPREEGGRVIEKGVLLVKNTERINGVRRAADMSAILERYALVLEPSWSGYANRHLLAYARFREHTILVMATCDADYEFLERLGCNLRPVRLGASDWVNPEIFRPIEGAVKEFDVVMVARWTLKKRQHVLLRAVREINDPGYRVALVAGHSSDARDRPAICELIARSGVARQITLFENLTAGGVNEVLNRSKVNVLLSLQEGSNRALFEGFFAGTPGVALARNLGIPKSYFSEKTGVLIRERGLVDTLVRFRERWREYDPRSWALKHITPELSAGTLNRALRDLARERNEPWSRDIVAKCNVPNLAYYPDAGAGEGLATLGALMADEGIGQPFSRRQPDSGE